MRSLFLLLSSAAAAPLSAAKAQTPPTLEPCAVTGLTGDVVCATVPVPEDRTRPDGRQIGIAVVIARATRPARAPDPFVLLAGGPGQAGTQMGPFASDAFSKVREQRDLVLIDARGTGRSNGLRCAMMRRPGDFGAATMYPETSVRFCRDSLSRVADLRQYTTANIADDLEDVRRAFGWPALNLYGTSYGSRVAFTFLRRHEGSVRTAVLKAVAPPTQAFPMTYARDAEAALSLLERDCLAERACATAFPSIRSDLDTVLARARRGLVRAGLPAELGTGADSVTLAADMIAGLVFSGMQSAHDRAQLPMLLRLAASGNTRPLAQLAVQARLAIDRMLYIGMHLSAMCADDGRRLDLDAALADDGNTFLGRSRVRMLKDACALWPLGAETIEGSTPVRSQVPVLLVSGELDPNLPPRHADEALRTLPRARHVVLRGVAHGWSNVAECGSAFVAAFVERASVDGLDLSCADTPSAPPFVTSSRP
jgi:pimeloyl-ACP methyl ester carboxylesterase